MNIKRITAIVPVDILQCLEKHLRGAGVPGVTVERVRGYGEHPNYFRKDLMQDNARLILYTTEDMVGDVIDAMTACARECKIETGIVAVHDVDRLVHLGNGLDVHPASLHG